jgi:hypothetical protein
VNLASILNPPPVFVEIGPDWLKARHGGDGVELPLERGPGGSLTAQGKEKTIAALKDFLKPKSWQPRAKAWCAINSRGVSLRRLSLPAGTKEEFHQRLLLQIESEFPLPPDELAWGCQPLGQPEPTNGVMPRQDLLVAAVKKEQVAEYYEILRACWTDPAFTLASMARWNFGGQPANAFAMLDIGATQSELTLFENSVPASSRIIFWDGKNTSSLPDAQLETLAQSIRSSLAGTRLLVSGNGISRDFTERLERSLGNGCRCERLESAQATGNSAAISGLQKFAAEGGSPTLVIRLQPTSVSAASFASVDWKTWGTRVGALLAAALLLPYAEALLLKPHLEKKVAAFKAESQRLTVIDRELDFLRNLKVAQPPYLDVLYVFSKSVPQGTRFDALSLNSHGEVSMRCAFHDGQQVADFRDKLIASGFFTNIVVEEQVPTPDRQRVNVRMTALEKNAAQLQVASARLTADDSSKPAKSSSPGRPPGMPSGPPDMGGEPQ